MKRVSHIIAGLCWLALAALTITGCNSSLQAIPNTSAKIANATPAVVADLAAAGALTNAIAAQIAAANPNNAKIQAAVAKLQSGIALTNTDAAALAPAVQLANGSIQVVAVTASVK